MYYPGDLIYPLDNTFSIIAWYVSIKSSCLHINNVQNYSHKTFFHTLRYIRDWFSGTVYDYTRLRTVDRMDIGLQEYRIMLLIATNFRITTPPFITYFL